MAKVRGPLSGSYPFGPYRRVFAHQLNTQRPLANKLPLGPIITSILGGAELRARQNSQISWRTQREERPTWRQGM
jgi:hypothetical protein